MIIIRNINLIKITSSWHYFYYLFIVTFCAIHIQWNLNKLESCINWTEVPNVGSFC
jgi:hypothetical protein